MFVTDWLITAIPHASTHAALLLILGLIALGVGGNYIVPATIKLGTALRLSPTIIAIIVVAGGTSAPELIVSLQAALEGSADIALGNVIGSNLSNLLLVMGLAALLGTFTLHHRTAIRTSLIMLGFTIVTIYSLHQDQAITPMIGWILLGATIAYLLYLTRIGDINPAPEEGQEEGPTGKTAPVIIAPLCAAIGAIIALLLGADFVVTGGVVLAMQAGLSEAAIGLSIIAIGTSLPEIVAVVASVMQKRSDVALGNVLGSNIFNLGMILGITSLVAPLPRGADISDATLAYFGLATLLVTALIISRMTLKRPIGVVFIGFYFAFLIMLI